MTPQARHFVRGVARLNTLLQRVANPNAEDGYAPGATIDCLVSLGFDRGVATTLVESFDLVRPTGRRECLDALLASRRGPVLHEGAIEILRDDLENTLELCDKRDEILTKG